MSWQLSGAAYEAIGRVAAASAELDYELMQTLMQVVKSEEAHLLIAGQPYAFIYESLKRLLDQLPKGMGAVIKPHLLASKELHEMRDVVIHGVWLPTGVEEFLRLEDPTEFFAVRPRRWRTNLLGKQLSLADIQGLAKDIERLAAIFQKFRVDYLDNGSEA